MRFVVLAISVSALMLSGCMDTYMINSFKSADDFYRYVNNETEGHSLSIKLMRDSTIESDNIHIKTDSTFLFKKIWEVKEGKTSSFPRSEIKDIEFQKFDPSGVGNTAIITFNDDRKVLVRNLFANKDSVIVTTKFPQKVWTNKRISFPTSEIEMVSYNNRFKAMAEDAGLGMLAGFMIGIQASSRIVQPVMGGGADPIIGDVFGMFGGALSGTLIGAILGADQQFVFKDVTKQKGLTSYGITGGLNTSTISSSNQGISGSVIFYNFGIFASWSFNKNFSIRSEMIYVTKGGEFSTTVNENKISYYNRTAYLNFLELPVTFQYTISQRSFRPRFYLGPSFGFFLNGRVDEQGYNNFYGLSFPAISNSRSVKAAEIGIPDAGILIGAGVNLRRNITFDVQYDFSLSRYSSSLYAGNANNLKPRFLIFKFGYEL